MQTPDQFRATVEDFLERTQMPPTRFGKLAAGDPNFIIDLRKGREPRFSTTQRVRQFMDSHARRATPSQPEAAA